MHGVLASCRPMDRSVTHVSKPTQNVDVLADHLKSVAPKGKQIMQRQKKAVHTRQN